jgi:hypothetical protein
MGQTRFSVGTMRTIAKAKLKDLCGLLSGDVIVARAALLRHVEKIEMEANGESYVAKGNWNFLGNRARDGAGGPTRTDRDIRFTIRVAA